MSFTGQNVTPAEPSMKDALDAFRKDILLNMNCHHIGTIQSFNATKQTVQATINYKSTFLQNNSTNSFVPVLVDYPILIDCPAVVMGGGNAFLTMPIAKGDECLILFNDRDMDNWFQSGGGGEVATPRLHSFSDGIALVGIHSMAHLISGYDAVRAVLRGGNAKVGVNPSNNKVLIANNAQNLNTLLQQLLSAIQALTVVTIVDGSPVTSSPPVNAASFASIATAIGGLLE